MNRGEMEVVVDEVMVKDGVWGGGKMIDVVGGGE